MSRRWRNLPSRRGKYWTGYQSSPIPAVPPPQLLRPAGSLRFAARLLPSRRRWFDPGWGQANQGTAFPLFTRPAGARPRWDAQRNTSRGRRFDPPWSTVTPSLPSFMRQAGSQRAPARIRSSQRRRFDPGWTPQPAAVFTLGEPYFQWAAGTPYLS